MANPADGIFRGAQPDLTIRKGNAVYHALKSAILLRQLEPEESIGEQQVAGELGCSQGTVREALLRLQEDGLVERRGYRGTLVSVTTMAEAAEMAMIRIRLETEGIRRAQKTYDAGRRHELVDILERMERAGENGDAYSLSELDRLFHLTLFDAARMAILKPVLSRCALHMHRYTFANDPQQKLTLSPVELHAPILNALDAGDPDGAARAVKSHIEAVLERWSPELLRTIQGRSEAG